MSMVSPLPNGAPIGTFKGRDGKDVPIQLHPQFNAWLSSVQNAVRPLGGNGPTTARPVNTAANPLYIGQDFFDTTLGLKVSVKSLNPTVWVNGAGAPV